MNTEQPLPAKAAAAHRITFGYDPHADRLRLVVAFGPGGEGDETRECALTRRLTGRLVDGFATLLERTSATAAKAPAGMRDDIILLEHQGAISGERFSTASKEGSAAGKAARGATESADHGFGHVPTERLALLDAVDVAVRPTAFDLTLKAAGATLMALSLSRAELHRIVEMLSRQAARAGWNLEAETAWLALLQLSPETASVTLN